MSGMNVELRNTWEFMVSELLAQFNDPKTGYIALNKRALSYSAAQKDFINSDVTTKAEITPVSDKELVSPSAVKTEVSTDLEVEKKDVASKKHANSDAAAKVEKKDVISKKHANSDAVAKVEKKDVVSKEPVGSSDADKVDVSSVTKQSEVAETNNVTDGAVQQLASTETNNYTKTDDAQLESTSNNSGWFASLWPSSSPPPAAQDAVEEEKKKKKKEDVEVIEDSAQNASIFSEGWNALTWAARALAGDTVDLTAAKVIALEKLVQQTDEDMRVALKIQKLFINEQEEKTTSSGDLVSKDKANKDAKNTELKEIKEKELKKIQERIRLLSSYGAEAEAKISSSIERTNEDRQAQKKSARAPGLADAYLKIWDGMLAWMATDSSLLHICLAFEAEANAESKGELFTKRDDLERKFVTYLFRTMFTVKQDEIRHSQKETTGYTRQLSSAEATKLIKKLQETIKNLNSNVTQYPGLRRIEHLGTLIESVQQTVNTAYKSIESTRYSLLSDSAAEWLPSQTPTIIASTPNKFLIKMESDLREFHKDCGTLKTAIGIYLGHKDTQEARSRLLVAQ